MSAPRILIVDDQRDISRMLRSALETLGRGYVIVDVPSAEEAQLEFRRGPVDLLITDLRLPGISGLELIRRLHKASSAASMIVISGYADEVARSEFRSLGANFFAKPLDLHAFLKGVQDALGSREPSTAAAPAPDERLGIADRLARLRRDLGALTALLVSVEGRIVAQVGEAPNLDLNALAPHVLAAFRASLTVSQALGGQTPANVHFFDGAAYDAYSADVGEYFALLVVFDGQRGAGQMGPMLRYGRQAADDLLNTLHVLGVQGSHFPPEAAEVAPPPRRKKTGPLRKKTGPLPPAPPAPAEASKAASKEPGTVSPEASPALDAPAQKTTSQAAAEFWEGVDASAIGDARKDTLTWEQAAKLGIVPPKP